MKKKKILFTLGSPNQTSQMFAIYKHLKDRYDCYFSQFFPDKWHEKAIHNLGLLKQTILDGHFRDKSESFVKAKGLQYDYAGKENMGEYALVFLCSDTIYPRVAKGTKSIFVQEGMVDKLTPWAKFVLKMRMHPILAFNTALNGSQNTTSIYCVASLGYKNHFTKMGTDANKIVVTGIPNYDNAKQYVNNTFQYKNYVLACTSDMRETFRFENRPAFIRKVVKIAAGRPLIFKLHPNEIWDRACREIDKNAPKNTLIFQDGDTNAMIANCTELITQWSTVVFIGLALGKKCHSNFPQHILERCMPEQNDGQSAKNIAELAHHYIKSDLSGTAFLQKYRNKNPIHA